MILILQIIQLFSDQIVMLNVSIEALTHQIKLINSKIDYFVLCQKLCSAFEML